MIASDILDQAIAARSGKKKPTYTDLAVALLGDASYAGELRKAVEQKQKTAKLIIPPIGKDIDPYDLHINGFLHIDGKSLLIADLHAPFQNASFLREAVKIARKYGVVNVVIAGDLFDSNELSSYRKQQEVYVPVSVDLEHGLAIVNFLLDYFKVKFIPGNHDWWLFNHYGVSVAEFWSATKLPVESTEYPYAFLNDTGLVGHLDTYDFIAGNIAAQIAKARKKHTFVGHDHIAGYIQGDYTGVSMGAMLMADRIYYKHVSFNAYPEWQNGFVIATDSYRLYREEKQEAHLYYEF